ncbi:hypothetical protein BC938DRAFT_475745 [Jimgerdemannia flammicorona]|uniref:Uncharacterized protein n=1 Tax=Jimgerdemannia flammicorona TaxID=994334 RepID=A0A433PPJ2_9FUNG|nr:hypothetical protein BC938DRAFT_475745 [Jimgerdemannia flammicorona]
MKASRAAFNEIGERFSVFPFSIRSLRSTLSRLGVPELVNRGLLTPYATLRTPRPTEPVAHFKATILLTPQGPLRITLPQSMPFVHSKYTVVEGTTAAAALAPQNEVRAVKEPKGLPDIAGEVVFGRKPVDVEVTMDLS